MAAISQLAIPDVEKVLKPPHHPVPTGVKLSSCVVVFIRAQDALLRPVVLDAVTESLRGFEEVPANCPRHRGGSKSMQSSCLCVGGDPLYSLSSVTLYRTPFKSKQEMEDLPAPGADKRCLTGPIIRR